MRRIKIATQKRKPELYARGHTPRGVSTRFAVTRGEWWSKDKNYSQRWVVTHVPTGMACCDPTSREVAIEACKRFAALAWLDRDKPMKGVTREQKMEAEIIRCEVDGRPPPRMPASASRKPHVRAPGTLVSLSEAEYRKLSERGAGLCLACGDLDDAQPVEPDARKYKCHSCGEMQVYGLEEAMIMGKVDIAP